MAKQPAGPAASQVIDTAPVRTETQGLIQIAALAHPIEEVQHALAVNMGAMGLSPFDFSRFTIPTGGGTYWTLDSLTGTTQEPAVQGIISVAQDARVYFSKPFGSQEKQPPDCSSRDGFTGVGNPGGDCFKCPLNVFGTKQRDGALTRGKACREGKQIFLLRNEMLPELLSLPPTSLKACKQYLLRLAGSGIPYYDAVTEITLERINKTPAYSEARFRFIRRLTPEESARSLQLHELFESLMMRVAADVPDEPSVAVSADGPYDNTAGGD